jgi:hypothetical protein
MGELFRRWRRKTGCMTLVLACVAMGGWVRSQNHLDHVSLNLDDETIHAFNSTPFGIEWMKQRSTGVQWFTGRIRASSNRSTPEKYDRIFESLFSASDLCGFRVGIGKDARILVVPYWFIVLPLTLLSAWLLLSKPRTAIKPASIAG